MAPICASFGFRSKVQSTEGARVKPIFWRSYSREVLWKTKFTFAAKSSSQAWWHQYEKTHWLVGHWFPVVWERSCTSCWDWGGSASPFGHRNWSCTGAGSPCLDGWRWSLGFHRPYQNHQSGMKIKLMKLAEVWFPGNMPTAPSLLWAGWDIGVVREGIGFNLTFILETDEATKGHSGLRSWELLQQWCACHLCCRMTELWQPGGLCRGNPWALPLLLCFFRPVPGRNSFPYTFLLHHSIFLGFVAWTAWDSPRHWLWHLHVPTAPRREREKHSLRTEQGLLSLNPLGRNPGERLFTTENCWNKMLSKSNSSFLLHCRLI